MLFWVSAAALTIICVAAALYPLVRDQKPDVVGNGFDVEVYKDQLAEITRDETGGLISAADAETARIEVSRRILNVSKNSAPAKKTGSRAREISALLVAAMLPILSWGGYSLLGSPEIPDQPIMSRTATNSDGNSVDALIAKAEAHLLKEPNDGRGWDVLAPIYVRMGRFDDAVTAYSKSIELNGETATRQSGLGEALSGASAGTVSTKAKQAFDRAIVLDANEPKARLFLAINLVQQGRRDEAKLALEAQLAVAPKDAPWRPVIENALASLNNVATAGKVATGPSQQQVDDAAQMSGGDRMAMIETMVAGLADKLKDNPSDVEGWQKLIRSYLVLNKKDEAAKAFDAAQSALKDDTAKLETLRTFAKDLGLGGA